MYRLEVEYTPSVGQEAVTSSSVRLQVTEAPTDELREIAAINTDEVKRSVALIQFDTPPVRDELQTMATEYPNRKEGMIARLALIKLTDETRTETVLKPTISIDLPTVARWITALFGTADTENPLTTAFLDEVGERSNPTANIACDIVRGKSIPD
ncbi:hypothetical protein [Halocatena salina]|uniref:Uncharacterized protein n=1 Tax=Halocatena salina TaxID=2934340 RepID=A0A8U0A7H6_9EURY|nr:hypothetical protein [Halocatena salina]UPM45140.1 hypothetical protein MW046_17430 [Halocatena salina]